MKLLLNIIVIFALHSAVIAGNNDKVIAPVKNVCGKIITAQGEEIAGVKITIKETNETFFADLDGNFKLQVKTDKPYSISVQGIGFAPKEVKSTDLNMFAEISLKKL